jgi:hypothetical protein
LIARLNDGGGLDFSTIPVPEPASLGLLAAASLLILRRKQRP